MTDPKTEWRDGSRALRRRYPGREKGSLVFERKGCPDVALSPDEGRFLMQYLPQALREKQLSAPVPSTDYDPNHGLVDTYGVYRMVRRDELECAMAVVNWLIAIAERVGCPCDSADSLHSDNCPLVVNGFINRDGSRRE